MKNSNHILVIRLSALGDVAMSVPVLRAVVKQFPNLKISVLTKLGYAPIFNNINNVEVIEAEVYGKHKGVLGLYRLSREIRKSDIDMVADLHNVLRTKALKLFMADLPFKQIDKGREEKDDLISGKSFKQLKPTTQRYADVFKKLGFDIDLSRPEFPERAKLNAEILAYLGADGNKWVGIAPFAAHKGKMYPIDLMEIVIRDISKQYKVILFGGGKDEVDILNNLASKYENVLNVAGRYTLDKELKIISNLDVMLSMDSGNAHLAAMQGIEVITLWGVTHPYAGFYPFNQDINNALLASRKEFPKIPTSIYGDQYPKGYDQAMRTIAPLKVIEKINSIVG